MYSNQDRYKDLSELRARLRSGKHFRIRTLDRKSKITVVSPHGGRIEPGSSRLARVIAGDDLNFFDFQGLTRFFPRPVDLHVTSTRFRDEILDRLLAQSLTAVSIHGMGTEGKGQIWIGGLNQEAKSLVAANLVGLGFAVDCDSPKYRGRSPNNFVNFPPQKGLQLELSDDVMLSLFAPHDRLFDRRLEQGQQGSQASNVLMSKFAHAVRLAVGA